ncbi:MAG: hypothetical protein KKG09_02460 [Verrucomicrobia bacterium]|nr:hypothetical protein [Verrucomicrobiota bacterium]MCG2681521.1 hypothetical protein [Kiritimatiellia bacterium]MBU4247363.1 hypothetical protein [Verrucomicrobiota bacterium]MBU4289982.1 hypothetical protein [Verrucomicrobiota bacterium]MBU4428999.1 hypothetical protein [Verrucomicrobiota bacterium]
MERRDFLKTSVAGAALLPAGGSSGYAVDRPARFAAKGGGESVGNTIGGLTLAQIRILRLALVFFGVLSLTGLAAGAEPPIASAPIFHDDFSGPTSVMGKIVDGALVGEGKSQQIEDNSAGDEFTFEYRFNGAPSFIPKGGADGTIRAEHDSYWLNKAGDSHRWAGITDMRLLNETLYYSNVGIRPDAKWHTVRFVKERTNDKVTVYYDNKVIPFGVWYTRPCGRLKSVAFGGNGGRFDDITVWTTAIHMPKKASYDPKTKTIALEGKGHTLASLAKDIAQADVFQYDPGKATAICQVNIRIEGAAELILAKETLLMAGGTKFRIDNAGEIHLRGSKLAAAEGAFDFYADWTAIIEIQDSAIEGVGNLTAYPRYGFLKNSKLTNIGKMTTALAVQPAYFNVEGLAFEGGDITFGNWWGDYEFFHNFMPGNYLVNSTFKLGQGKLIAANNYVVSLLNCRWDDKSSPERLAFGRKIHTIPSPDEDMFMVRYYLDVKVVDENGNPVPEAVVEVVNEAATPQDKQLRDLNMTTMWPWLKWPGKDEKGKDGPSWKARELYYWCATPVVMNAERARHEAQMRHGKYWLYTFGQPVNSAKTAANGHTSLPTEDPQSTLVVTDYRKTNGQGIKEYKYTIKVKTPSGKEAVVSGVDPDNTWYRQDPGRPQNTITVKVK